MHLQDLPIRVQQGTGTKSPACHDLKMSDAFALNAFFMVSHSLQQMLAYGRYLGKLDNLFLRDHALRFSHMFDRRSLVKVSGQA